jgi:hypothetical protein
MKKKSWNQEKDAERCGCKMDAMQNADFDDL